MQKIRSGADLGEMVGTLKPPRGASVDSAIPRKFLSPTGTLPTPVRKAAGGWDLDQKCFQLKRGVP